jgi:hypothetical protein
MNWFLLCAKHQIPVQVGGYYQISKQLSRRMPIRIELQKYFLNYFNIGYLRSNSRKCLVLYKKGTNSFEEFRAF